MNRKIPQPALGLLPLILLLAAQAQTAGPKLTIGRESLCVTEGAIEKIQGDRLSVDVPKMRAYVNAWTSQSIEAHFTYLGPTAQGSPLGSGQMRRQFGLKLRAQDPCNLVYAMWRIEPESEIVVSIKRNPGQSTSSECSNRGYRNIRPRRAAAVPPLRPGAAHTLGAEINRDGLQVFVDGAEVWEGDLGSDASDLKGPVGIRSDNARLAFALKAGAYAGAHPDYQLACKSGPEASE